MNIYEKMIFYTIFCIYTQKLSTFPQLSTELSTINFRKLFENYPPHCANVPVVHSYPQLVLIITLHKAVLNIHFFE